MVNYTLEYRQLDGPNAEKLSVTDLVKLENQLHAALRQIRAQKTALRLESVSALRLKETFLKEENGILKREIEELAKGYTTHPNFNLVHPL
ncbi:conserved hypothetical protein [Ricinus communis]|uniref:K-box domain-containing protein n=1 Tax=Ricinus communis TaxID=3988 RepID=B9RMC5_RICCO|nr:conserved hypothetical protein [Ricinus communis]